MQVNPKELVKVNEHNQEQQESIKQTNKSQYYEGYRLSTELIEKASKGWGNQTSKRNEGKSNSKSFRSFSLFCIPEFQILLKTLKTE